MPQKGPVSNGRAFFVAGNRIAEGKMRYSAMLLFLAGTVTGAAQAQNWTAYIPAERDFRVLFPSPPTRSTEADGSTAFRALFEHEEGSLSYAVYRLPRVTRRAGNPQAEIARHIQARRPNEDVEYLRDRDGTPDWDRHVFRHGRVLSVHRLVEHQGRFYELELTMPRGVSRKAMNTARDFFNSFQLTGIGLPTMTTVAQQLETWCKDRGDAFSQAFCRYSVCLQPGYEKYPHCGALTGLKDLF